jgi:hypothetical protein
LSVSTEAKISPAFTKEPISTFHFASTPWEIDSPMRGTGTSTLFPGDPAAGGALAGIDEAAAGAGGATGAAAAGVPVAEVSTE